MFVLDYGRIVVDSHADDGQVDELGGFGVEADAGHVLADDDAFEVGDGALGECTTTAAAGVLFGLLGEQVLPVKIVYGLHHLEVCRLVAEDLKVALF